MTSSDSSWIALVAYVTGCCCTRGSICQGDQGRGGGGSGLARGVSTTSACGRAPVCGWPCPLWRRQARGHARGESSVHALSCACERAQAAGPRLLARKAARSEHCTIRCRKGTGTPHTAPWSGRPCRPYAGQQAGLACWPQAAGHCRTAVLHSGFTRCAHPTHSNLWRVVPVHGTVGRWWSLPTCFTCTRPWVTPSKAQRVPTGFLALHANT